MRRRAGPGKLPAADAAFVGRLIRVTAEPVGPYEPNEGTFVYRVLRRYKGRLGRRVAVRSTLFSGNCGLDQQLGRRTALFLRRDRLDGRYEAGLCDEVSPAVMRRAARGQPTRRGSCG